VSDSALAPIRDLDRHPDGSWAEITLADTDGHHEVAEGGPRRLWSIVEGTHQRWTDLGRPGWDRFGLTMTRDRQTVWFDHPDTGPVTPGPSPPHPEPRPAPLSRGHGLGSGAAGPRVNRVFMFSLNSPCATCDQISGVRPR
jgi:hypothetical protein